MKYLKKNPVLLFDIDGTLLSVKKTPMIGIIRDVLSDLSLNVDLSQISYAGRTDAAIFSEIIELSDKPETSFSSIKECYQSHLSTKLNSNFVTSHIDSDQLLQFLSENKFEHGILTGNFASTAKIKLDAGGYSDLGDFGFFGDVHKMRRGISSEAADFYNTLEIKRNPEEIVIIGDTPNDIDCARHVGFSCIAVATGPFSHEELEEHKPNIVVDSIRDLDFALSSIF